jgi:hypothetical protein
MQPTMPSPSRAKEVFQKRATLAVLLSNGVDADWAQTFPAWRPLRAPLHALHAHRCGGWMSLAKG